VNALIGQYVIIRDNLEGVRAGTLESLDLAAGTWALRDSRMIHFWAKSAATSGIAVHGPGPGSRVCPVVAVVAGRDLVSVLTVTPEARATIEEYPEWRP